jgi:phosphatidylserine decarboxylase
MKKSFHKIIVSLTPILVISLLCCSCSGHTIPEATTVPGALPNHINGHKPIVQKLERLVATNATLRGEIEIALQAQDKSSFWYNQTIEDMYDFLDEWVTFLPKPDNVRFHMDAFYDFAGSAKGQEVVAKEPFRSWIYEFMVAIGQFMDSEESSAALNWWLNDPKINMEDYVIPTGGYKSFNEFFTRSLKPGARLINAPVDTSVLTSPADSSIMKLVNTLNSDTEIEVKGDSLNIRELLGNDERADEFVGGQAILCMLDTTDYHRFHSPVQGKIVAQHQLAGLYYGMTGGWVENFFEHRRGYFIFETDKFGHVGMVCVGMFTISSISFLTSEGDHVSKGDELGAFAYGGSAIILLFEPNHVSFSIPMDKGPIHVLMGEKIGFSISE